MTDIGSSLSSLVNIDCSVMFAGVIQSGWSLLLVNHIFLHSPPEAPGKHLKTLVRCSPGGSPAWCLCLATKVSDLSIISASPLRASDLHHFPWEGKYFVVKYFSSFFSNIFSTDQCPQDVSALTPLLLHAQWFSVYSETKYLPDPGNWPIRALYPINEI